LIVLRRVALGLALAAGVAAAPSSGLARATPPTAAPPQRDGSHDFDYWFGAWTEHSQRLLHPLTGSKDWVEMDGGSVVIRIWGGRANLVEFKGEGPGGRVELLSLRTYNPLAHQWSVNFATPGAGQLGVPAVASSGTGEATSTIRSRSTAG
jgi:hypothetical protein